MFGTMTTVEAHTEAEIGLSGLCSATFGVLSLMTLACSHMNDWAFFYNDPSMSHTCGCEFKENDNLDSSDFSLRPIPG